jgi:hypothetical protein
MKNEKSVWKMISVWKFLWGLPRINISMKHFQSTSSIAWILLLLKRKGEREREVLIQRIKRKPNFRLDTISEFSPNGRLFTLGSFFENYKSSPHFCATFFWSKDNVCINFVKKDWRFFHKLIWSTWIHLCQLARPTRTYVSFLANWSIPNTLVQCTSNRQFCFLTR